MFRIDPESPDWTLTSNQRYSKNSRKFRILRKKIKNTDFLPSFSGLVIWTMKEVGPQVVTFRASNALNAQEGSVTVEVIRAPEIQLRILKFLFGMI